MRARSTSDSPRLFSHDALDALSRTPWWTVPLIWLPIAATSAGFGLRAGVPATVLALQLAAGWFGWTLLEYGLHRTLFHWVPAATWGPRLHFLLHGVHHTHHRDRLRLVMPPAAAALVALAVVVTLATTAQLLRPWFARTWGWGVFAGIVVGYVVYDLTHYALHHATPRTAIGRALRTHHAKHHHNPAYKERKFGVSTTLWDHVFGTY
jgi:dihydroceramide fatty acyl 2-hydroxylase